MKAIKGLKRKKGFTLTEVLVAMAVFAIMSAIVMQILAISIRYYGRNDRVDKDLDAQIENLVTENALVERNTVELTLDFIGTSGSAAGSLTVDASVKKDSTDQDERLELNTFDAEISSIESGDDDENAGGGMITDTIHLYGTKGIDSIVIASQQIYAPGTGGLEATYEITLNIKIDQTTNQSLSQYESNAVKISLPDSARNVSVDAGDKLTHIMLSSTNVRLSDKDPSSKDNIYDSIKITFTLPESAYDTEYGSFAKYFIAPDSTSAQTSATFVDTDVPGIYNTVK